MTLPPDFAVESWRIEESRKSLPASKLTVAAHTSVLSCLLPPVIKEFRKQAPKAQLTLLARSREDIVRMVADGEADIGITSLKEVPPNLEYRVFAKYPRLLIAPRGHELARVKKVSASLFAKYPLIVELLDIAPEEAGVDPQVALEVTGRQAVKEYVRMGFGVSLVNAYDLNETERKLFAVKDVSSLFGYAERGLVTARNRNLGRAAEMFCAITVQQSHKHSD